MNTQPTSLSRYVLVVLCIAVVFTALVIVILNSWSKSNSLSSGVPALDQVLNGQSYEDGYKDGFVAARTKFSKNPPMPVDVAVTSLTGIVQSVDGNGIIVKASNLDTDPKVDGVSDNRSVIINSDTKITNNIPLSPDELSAKMADWRETGMKKGEMPPLAYMEKDLKLSDIKQGQQITVVSKDDIRLKESFTATQITVNNTVEVK